VSDPDSAGTRFIVPGDDVTAYFLAGQCGIQADRLLVRNLSKPEETANILCSEINRYPESWIVLVSDELTLTQVIGALEGIDGFSERFSIEELRAVPGEYPAYQLGLAIRPGAGRWRGLLEAARDDESFGSSVGQTARLYSRVLAAGLSGVGSVVEVGGGRRPPVVLEDFRLATEAFKEILCRDLLESLRGAMVSDPGSGHTRPVERGIDGQLMRVVMSKAEQVLPATWLPTLHGVAGLPVVKVSHAAADERLPQTQLPEVGYCRSCSVSLGVPHNRGVSDRYCRFCSDEEGHLKPRDEIQRLIAEWFEGWQGGLSRNEAMRRAQLFMQAMPAWCNN
jgi:hypothetical protein